MARHLIDVLDPDGTLADDAEHERRREFALLKRQDGSAGAVVHFGPAIVAVIEAFLDDHAAPRPAADGTPDHRSATQRNYDALYEGICHLLTCKQWARRHPDPGDPAANAPARPRGPRGTLLITMTAEQFSTATGLARTAHGDPISVPTALELVSGGHYLSVLFDPHGGVTSYGQTKRLVPRDMRLAITARDRGCTFPGCDRPPAWTQAHHFAAFAADGGPTSIDNCGLVCGYHHRNFARRGWQSTFINNRAHWTPPAWIDPDQIPRRNRLHDPPMRT